MGAVSNMDDRRPAARERRATEPPDTRQPSAVPLERMLALSHLTLVERDELRRLRLLAKALRDPDVDVLHTAAAQLARIGTRNSIDHLLGMALDEKEHVARRVTALSALRDVAFDYPHVHQALRQLSSGSETWLRATAREVLG